MYAWRWGEGQEGCLGWKSRNQKCTATSRSSRAVCCGEGFENKKLLPELPAFLAEFFQTDVHVSTHSELGNLRFSRQKGNENAAFWDVTPYGSCKNQRFG
jgi:hypothetical protein